MNKAKNNQSQKITWNHPGGKLLRKGAQYCSDADLLAILIGSGVPKKPAIKMAEEIIDQFKDFKGLANQPFEKLYQIKGLKKVKVIRIAAALEISRRIVNQVVRELKSKNDKIC